MAEVKGSIRPALLLNGPLKGCSIVAVNGWSRKDMFLQVEGPSMGVDGPQQSGSS